MRRTFFLILLLSQTINIYSYELRIDTLSVAYDKMHVKQIHVKVINNGNSPIWIWFNQRKCDVPDSVEIKRHLIKRNGEDFSIYDIATDPLCMVIGGMLMQLCPFICL